MGEEKSISWEHENQTGVCNEAPEAVVGAIDRSISRSVDTNFGMRSKVLPNSTETKLSIINNMLVDFETIKNILTYSRNNARIVKLDIEIIYI